MATKSKPDDKPELTALAEEAAAADLPQPDAPEAGEGEAVQDAPRALLAQPDAGLVFLGCQIIDGLGGIVTARAGVAPLTGEEVQRLGQAVATVAAQYDLDKLPPKTAAWIGLGLATMGVVAPRLPQRRAGAETPVAPGFEAPGADAAASPA